MSRLACLRAAAPILGVCLALASPAVARIVIPDHPAADEGSLTVVLADGWELAGVAATWYPDEGLLVVERPDGARRTLKPEQLAGLRDARGRDVTAEILPPWAIERLGGEMPPPSPPVPVEPAPKPAPVVPAPEPPDDPMADWYEVGGRQDADSWRGSARDPRAIFEIGAGYSAPHDQHFANLDGGFAFEATLRLQLAGPIYLSGGYLHQMLQRNDYMIAVPCGYPDDGCLVTGTADPTISGPWAGLSIVSAARTAQPVRFYLEGGVGRFAVEEMPLWSLDDAYLGYRLATGFLIPVGDQAAINLGVRALRIENLDFGWYGRDGDTMLGVHGGIALYGF
ncbi:hypothetical protein GF314_16075 [bacterium]|nr:hypothetical protein [bacterium]